MPEDTTAAIVRGMALAFFASAWAEAADESDTLLVGPGTEIMDVLPSDIDPAALHAARTLQMDMTRANSGATLPVLYAVAQAEREAGQGDRELTPELFGHYAAMQAMGHGVGLGDAFGAAVRASVQVPYVEFGSHSLQRDYF